MNREEKLQFLLSKIPKNASGMYKEGFEDGFECTYNALEKDLEAQLKAKDKLLTRKMREISLGEFLFQYAPICHYMFNDILVNETEKFLTQIYNKFEAELEAKDERIKELEDALNSAFVRDLRDRVVIVQKITKNVKC